MRKLYSHIVEQECLFGTKRSGVNVLDNGAPCLEQKCGESALCRQQNDVAKEIKYAKEFRSRHAMFLNRCNIKNGDYHVRRRFDREYL